ncbi:glycosyl hydrolase family 8 [Aquifex pyrophilus]
MLNKFFLLLFSVFLLSFTEKFSDTLFKAYEIYLKNVIQEDGRVIDWHNNGVTHSEGIGYTLFLSVIFGDKETFYKVLRWMEYNMGFNKFGLIPWLWGEKEGKWGVIDYNDASDGNMWIAYSLLLGYEKWGDKSLKELALRIIEAIKEHNIYKGEKCLYILGGSEGFLNDRYVVINPSYYFPPIFDKFYKYDKDEIWKKLKKTTEKIFKKFVVTDILLYPEWVYINRKSCKAEEFKGVMGFNAIRIPIWIHLSEGFGEVKRRLKSLAEDFNTNPKKVCSYVSMDFYSCRTYFSISLLPYNKALKKFIKENFEERNYYFLSLYIFANLRN